MDDVPPSYSEAPGYDVPAYDDIPAYDNIPAYDAVPAYNAAPGYDDIPSYNASQHNSINMSVNNEARNSSANFRASAYGSQAHSTAADPYSSAHQSGYSTVNYDAAPSYEDAIKEDAIHMNLDEKHDPTQTAPDYNRSGLLYGNKQVNSGTIQNELGCDCVWPEPGGQCFFCCKPGRSCQNEDGDWSCIWCCYCCLCWFFCFYCSSARLFQWSNKAEKCGCCNHCFIPCVGSYLVYFAFMFVVTGIALAVSLVFGFVAFFFFIIPIIGFVIGGVIAGIGLIIALSILSVGYLATPVSTLVLCHRHNIRRREEVGDPNTFGGDIIMSCPVFTMPCTLCQVTRAVDRDAWDWCCPPSNKTCCEHFTCFQNDFNYMPKDPKDVGP